MKTRENRPHEAKKAHAGYAVRENFVLLTGRRPQLPPGARRRGRNPHKNQLP